MECICRTMVDWSTVPSYWSILGLIDLDHHELKCSNGLYQRTHGLPKRGEPFMLKREKLPLNDTNSSSGIRCLNSSNSSIKFKQRNTPFFLLNTIFSFANNVHNPCKNVQIRRLFNWTIVWHWNNFDIFTPIDFKRTLASTKWLRKKET